MAHRDKWLVDEFTVKAFLERIGERAELLLPGTEPPDARVRIAKRAVGIELTECCGDALARAQGGSPRKRDLGELHLFKHWLRLGRTKYPELDYINARMWFAKSEKDKISRLRLIPPRSDWPEFVRQLIEFVRSNKPMDNGRESVFVSNQVPKVLLNQWQAHRSGSPFLRFPKDIALLHQYLERLEINRPGFYSLDWSLHCESTAARDRSVVQEQSLLDAVKSKQGKIESVRRDPHRSWLFDEMWLVIVFPEPVRGIAVPRLSTFQSLANAMRKLRCEAVFLYDYYARQVVRWKAERGWEAIRSFS